MVPQIERLQRSAGGLLAFLDVVVAVIRISGSTIGTRLASWQRAA